MESKGRERRVQRMSSTDSGPGSHCPGKDSPDRPVKYDLSHLKRQNGRLRVCGRSELQRADHTEDTRTL